MMISKNCQMLQDNHGSDSEDGSLPSKSVSNQHPMCVKETLLLRKINLTLGDLRPIKDLMEHFTRGKTLPSVSWPDYTVLVKTNLEPFGSSFAFLTLNWVPGSLLASSESKWVLPTKICIEFGPRISCFLDLLSAVHWEIHQEEADGLCFWFGFDAVRWVGVIWTPKTEVEIQKQLKSQVILSTSRWF